MTFDLRGAVDFRTALVQEGRFKCVEMVVFDFDTSTFLSSLFVSLRFDSIIGKIYCSVKGKYSLLQLIIF